MNDFFFNRSPGKLMSFFLVFHLGFPVYNKYRGVFLLTFNIEFLMFSFVIGVFLSLFLDKNTTLLAVLYKFLLSSFFLHRYFFSLGGIFLRDYPRAFGLYICLSLSSFYVIRFYPEELWIYPLYVFCVIFINVCIVPLAGFGFIINLIKQKDDYDKNSFTTLEKPTPQNASANWIVFQNLEIDDLFKSQFDLWSNWIDSLKPTVSSTKRSFWASLIIGICWNITFFFNLLGKNFKNNFQQEKREF